MYPGSLPATVTPMTTSCLISNFNYGNYVEEAVNSALAQTHALDEIIVVDDGSTDHSPTRLAKAFGKSSRVRILGQTNQGQLAAIHAGMKASTGDILFLLDADDVWDSNYVSRALDVYARRERPDCVFTALEHMGRSETIRKDWPNDRDFGRTVTTVLKFGLPWPASLVRSLAQRPWIGSPTSALSMKRWVLDEILPVPSHDDWRIRADDCLIFGSSAIGARKYFLAEPLVRYRIHDANHFQGRPVDSAAEDRRELALASLIQELAHKGGRSLHSIRTLAASEFLSRNGPTWFETLRHVAITMYSPHPLGPRLRQIIRMIGHYVRHCIAGPGKSGS